ncbi:APC family permease [Piscirickettsia salmonis]|uniref:APC family permease n=1 Tax=Piscirickettsia salmonis TaxID=1238 RepID=UPI0002F4AC4A|nr:APC family permease [Piscirickettsia salmonis]APS56097.1 amino acid permease [Piscirickettsia salmonis]ERL62741.1 amino acid permease family protein [Piscirickettsia salmonis LF-89 = ATCC VR-1361]PEQ15708.1 APC family permease [Piscirickettsia salmonis]QGN77354.1 L-aspartate transporter [Piscirickettsia salmonis]QGN80939.1 L-aspartate transporter [Piscirickettsia salmonis]
MPVVKQGQRHISPWGMMLCSVSAILGSGWLFSSFYSAQLAGAGAIVAWILGGVLILCVAFSFAETSTLLPVGGGSAYLPFLTHGNMVSLILGSITWLTFATLQSVEVQATLQYLANLWPVLLQPETTSLSTTGMGLAVALMLLFSSLNIYSLRWVIRLNNILTYWKILVPVMIAVALMFTHFSVTNFHYQGHFLSNGWHGVFAAMSMGGIVFAFNGFKQVVELAGEAHNPKRTIPFALAGSIFICLAIYLLLQVAFIGALSPTELMAGWSHLSLASTAGPLAVVVAPVGVLALVLLYSNAVVAPAGSALMYVASASRTLHAMSGNRQMPKAFAELSARGMPVKAIVINTVLGLVFFFPLPGWKAMVEFITSLVAFSYSLGPVCVLVLRYQLPEERRVVRLPFVWVWSYVGLYICVLMSYWTGWQTISKLFLFLVFCFVLYFLYRVVSERARSLTLEIRSSLWMWVYFIGVSLVSYLGTFGGGHGKLGFGPDALVLAVLTALILYLAVRFRRTDEQAKTLFRAIGKELAS